MIVYRCIDCGGEFLSKVSKCSNCGGIEFKKIIIIKRISFLHEDSGYKVRFSTDSTFGQNIARTFGGNWYKRVSPIQFKIIQKDNKWTITEGNNPVHATKVNGNNIGSSNNTEINDGDLIEVKDLKMRVIIEDINQETEV